MIDTKPRQHLAIKLAGFGLGLALLVTLASSSFFIWFDYHQQTEQLHNDIGTLLTAQQGPSATAVFTVSNDLAENILSGMMAYPYITQAAIFDELNRPLAQIQREINDEQLLIRFFKRFEVHERELTHRGNFLNPGPLGRLVITIDRDMAYADFYRRAVQVTSITLVWVLSYATLLFIIFYQLSTKPILNIIRALDRIELGTHQTQRIPNAKAHSDDEIGRLIRDLNGFIGTADRLLSERDLANINLKKTYDEIRHLVDFLPQLIFIADQYGYIRLSNKKFRQLLGMHKNAIEGLHKSELSTFFDGRERDFLLGPDDNIIRTGNPVIFPEVQITDVNKELRTFEISKFSITFENSNACLTVAIDTTELHRSAEKIQHLAYHDALTDLPNRNLFIDRLNRAILRSKRNQTFSALLFIDLDGFKAINDSLGHAAGDDHLRHIAKLLLTTVRDIDTVARLGGDEFVICLGDLSTSAEEAQTMARARAVKIRELICAPYETQHRKVFVSASIGISIFPKDNQTAFELLKSSDTAMYNAKSLGKNTEVVYESSMGEAVNHRVIMENDLRVALERQEFFLCYQPQLACQGNRLTGAEALLRWRHPSKGLIPPSTFIPLLEATGLIGKVGTWVIQQACQAVKTMQQQGLWRNDMRMGINVSPFQFTQINFTDTVLAAVEQAGIDIGTLDLEVTESMLIHNFKDVTARMHDLKRHGVHFSIDDFGTGYSSLSYLKMLPLNVLKIDQSFIRDVLDDANDEAIVASILAMAGHLGLETVAEGVENEGQLAFIQRHGCHRYQGYLYSKAIPLTELAACFRQHQDQQSLTARY